MSSQLPLPGDPSAGASSPYPAPPPPADRDGAGADDRSAVVALVVVLVAAFMELLDATIVSVAAPAIARDLGASEAAVQWMVAGYTLALGAGLITGGRLGD